MDLVGRKIIGDSGLGIKELTLEMQEFAKQKSLSALLSTVQLDHFKQSLNALEKASTLVLNNAENKHYAGMIAFDILMMAGYITAAWQMLASLKKAKTAFENKTISSAFFESKTKSVDHFINSILPRYAGHFMAIRSVKTGAQKSNA